MNSIVYGIGVNDAEYSVCQYEKAEGKWKLVWRCPFYVTWKNMLARCYSEKFQEINTTYIGCYTVPEWHLFSNFKSWMEQQDWQGSQLDKDILIPRNKVYGPDTCVFVNQSINSFLIERNASRGEFPIGVSFDKISGKFRATCSSVTTGGT